MLKSITIFVGNLNYGNHKALYLIFFSEVFWKKKYLCDKHITTSLLLTNSQLLAVYKVVKHANILIPGKKIHTLTLSLFVNKREKKNQL